MDALAAALWPDGGPADPANALKTPVSRLRRARPYVLFLQVLARHQAQEAAVRVRHDGVVEAALLHRLDHLGGGQAGAVRARPLPHRVGGPLLRALVDLLPAEPAQHHAGGVQDDAPGPAPAPPAGQVAQPLLGPAGRRARPGPLTDG